MKIGRIKVINFPFGMSQQQSVVAILVFIMCVAFLWIIAHALVDLIRYLIFHFSHRSKFTPRSWLFIAIASLLSIVFIARGQVAKAASVEILADSETQNKTNPSQDLIPVLSCSVVVAGLIFEIGKQRGNRLRQLQTNSRLNHPSATAVRTEVALRATLEVKSSQTENIYLDANSQNPIFIPFGICDSKMVFIDIGQRSIINILKEDATQTIAVVDALVAATLFSIGNKVKPIFLIKDRDKVDTSSLLFPQVAVVSNVQEVSEITASVREHCVVFTASQISQLEVDQLLANNCAVISTSSISCATFVLQANQCQWRLMPSNIMMTPFGLLSNEAHAINELLIDVDRSLQLDTNLMNFANIANTRDLNSENLHRNCEKWNVLVRTLGPVDVQLNDGTVIEFEKSKTKELLAWLTSHRSRPTRSAARTALWDVNVADATFTNIVSDARRMLNQTHLISNTEEWLPRTFNDQLPFHISIISDGEILESCITRAHELEPNQAIAELHRGLELVRDLPFSGTGYLWPDAEGITSQLVLNVITASAMAGELDLQRGEIEGVFWATSKGLKVLGAHEELIALRMRAHALRGDFAGVRGEWHSYERAVKSDSWANSQPSPKLLNLYNQLNSGMPVSLAR